MRYLIDLTILVAFLVLSQYDYTNAAAVIDPVDAPAVNKRQTKPYFFRKPKKILVAIIDTGIDAGLMNDPSICPSGHKDFTGQGLVDNHGHGTNISGIIDQYAKNYILTRDIDQIKGLSKVDIDYCQIIIKYYDPKMAASESLKNSRKAIRWAIDHKVDIINYSAGGDEFDLKEKALIVEALNKGIKVVAAAGNDGRNIDKVKYYPASYDKRIYIVGNLVSEQGRFIANSSNTGKTVNTWEIGTHIFSRLPGNSFGYMSGTSQATAVKSGKLVRELLNSK